MIVNTQGAAPLGAAPCYNMDMIVPATSWHILTLTLYSTVVAFVSILLSWPVPAALFFLCGLPLVLLVFESHLPLLRLIASVGVLATVVIILDAVAHTTGSWYTLSTSSWRLMGITFESALFAFVHTLYFLLLYEFTFDDGRLKSVSWRRSTKLIAVLVSFLIATFYLFSVWIVSFAFAWIIVLLLSVIIGVMVLGHPGDSKKLLLKSLFFGVLLLPMSLAFEMIALHGGVRVFAFTSEYVAVFSLLGQSLPLEELFLLIVWPTLLVLMYESFIDDGI